MAKKAVTSRRPTDAEFVILRALWDIGPASVREVCNHLNEEKTIGYTTVLKLMQIMNDKGLLEKDCSQRPQVYRPAEAKENTQKGLVQDLTDRAFAGSAGSLVLQALGMNSPSTEELKEIRKMIDAIEEKQQ